MNQIYYVKIGEATIYYDQTRVSKLDLDTLVYKNNELILFMPTVEWNALEKHKIDFDKWVSTFL